MNDDITVVHIPITIYYIYITYYTYRGKINISRPQRRHEECGSSVEKKKNVCLFIRVFDVRMISIYFLNASWVRFCTR